MPAQDNSRFVIRDRNWHPKALTPDYKTSIARSPRQALVSIPQSISETTGRTSPTWALAPTTMTCC